MWSADGKSLYYVSEIHGTPANIVRLPLDSISSPPAAGKPVVKPQQITFHKDDGVRRARISGNGRLDRLRVRRRSVGRLHARRRQPRKLAIEVNADDKANPEQLKIFTNGATEFSLSADEKFMAFAVHGELFRMSVGPEAKVVQMTDGRPTITTSPGRRTAPRSSSSPTATATRTSTCSKPTIPSTPS